jgi:aquaporin Z
MLIKKYLTEFLGTHILAHVIFKTGNWLAIGSALAILVFLGGPISGGSFNPAVSIAMYFGKKIQFEYLFFSVVSQVLGALSAKLMLQYMK